MANPNGTRAMTAARAVLDGKASQAEAARHHGVTRQAVHRAIERIKRRAAAKIAGESANQMIVDDPIGGA